MFRKEWRAFSLADRLSEEEDVMQVAWEQRWVRQRLQELWKYELQEKWEK